MPKKFRGTWYYYVGNGKVETFKITHTKINLSGYADGGKARTYKFTKRAYNAKVSSTVSSSHQLISSKGNRIRMSYPRSETTAAYVTNNRKKIYVFVTTWSNTYYKSKSAARKNYKADRSMSRRNKLSKLVWG